MVLKVNSRDENIVSLLNSILKKCHIASLTCLTEHPEPIFMIVEVYLSLSQLCFHQQGYQQGLYLQASFRYFI